MSKVQAKHREKHHDDGAQLGGKNNAMYYTAAVVAVVFALVVVPDVLGMLKLSFLSAGAGLNKLFSVIIAAAAGWACLRPSAGYKDFVELAKGARIEWQKTVKPDKDTVIRTTMMVLALVFVFAMLILLLDGIFGALVRAIVN